MIDLVLALVALIGGQTFFGTPVFGATDATISITISSSLSLGLSPGLFGSTSQTVSVTTDNYTGYTAALTNPTNSTDLVNVSDNTKIIPTITLPQGFNSITQNQFTNGYGFSIDGTNYVPAPTSSSDLTLGNRSVAGTGTHSLYFGVLPDINTSSGTYTKNFVVTVVANNPQYSITYNANAGTDTVTNMPSNQSVTISSTGTATLSSSTPTRSGYAFLGWDEDGTVTSNPTYSPGDIITLEPTQANAITLYAIWGSSSQGSGTWDDPYINSTATTYDPSSVPTGVTTQYENITGLNADIKVAADANGNITRFEFVNVDSTNGITIASNGNNTNFNTGVLAFTGNSFTVHIKFRTDLSQSNENGKFVLTAIQKNGSNYDGFSLYNYNSGYLRIASYVNRPRSSQTGLITPSTYIGLSSSRLTGERDFEVDITYNPSTPSLVGSLVGALSNRTISGNNVPTSLANATITIGGNGVDSNDDMRNLKIWEFSVTKN